MIELICLAGMLVGAVIFSIVRDHQGLPMSFKIGDTVALKSGGPIMTVSFVGPDYLSCIWFDVQDHLQRDTFRKDTVVAVTYDGRYRQRRLKPKPEAEP